MSESARVSGRPGAFALACVAATEGLATVVGVLVTGMSPAAAADTFLISNATLGIAYAISGTLIAWHRPRNAVGWLLLGAAIAHMGTAAVTPWLAVSLTDGGSAAIAKALVTAYSGAWPWAVALFLPLTLWVFPDGRLVSGAWRWGIGVIALNAVLQVLLFSADAYPLVTADGFGPDDVAPAVSWISVPGLGDGLFTASDLVLAATYLAGAVGMTIRYRRDGEKVRLQLLWPLLATTVTALVIGVTRVADLMGIFPFPVLSTLVVVLIPASVAVAVLRYRLLDIRLIWSRTVAYALLTAAVVGIYVGMVELASLLLRTDRELVPSVVATLVVAVGINPVRVRLQRLVDRWVYGERRDPVRAASSVTRRLAASADQPRDVLPAVCAALRLPWAAIVVDGVVTGEHGQRVGPLERIPLRHAGDTVGELQVGVRRGQKQLDPADRGVLELMALPIGVALRAEALTAAVNRSRQEIVAAREEERRRIRCDLHDGLASVLTGVAFQADAVATLACTDPHRTMALAEDIRAGVTGAIADVRRLINELHPAALHDHGLLEAVRRHARRLGGTDPAPLTITVSGHGADDLPAAVEVAAYRILVEALTNVARHSGAAVADVEIRRGEDELRLTVRDDGRSCAPWTPGIGLRSMAERAEELGGQVRSSSSPDGGRVEAWLPLREGVS